MFIVPLGLFGVMFHHLPRFGALVFHVLLQSGLFLFLRFFGFFLFLFNKRLLRFRVGVKHVRVIERSAGVLRMGYGCNYNKKKQ